MLVFRNILRTYLMDGPYTKGPVCKQYSLSIFSEKIYSIPLKFQE